MSLFGILSYLFHLPGVTLVKSLLRLIHSYAWLVLAYGSAFPGNASDNMITFWRVVSLPSFPYAIDSILMYYIVSLAAHSVRTTVLVYVNPYVALSLRLGGMCF